MAEILTRQTFISETGTEILNEVQKIRDSINVDSIDKKKFETDYRRQVVRKLDHLQLFGVDVSSSSKRYKLSLAYISLSVESKDIQNDYDLVNIEKCLEVNNRLVVKGLAGSGKTTLLQWVAIKTAGHKMPVELEEWNSKIPFFIRLRQYSSKSLPTPDEFVRDFLTVYGDAMPNGWTKDKLTEGNAILLIDGLDEIELARRLEVKEWITQLDSLYPKIKMIITSRPYAIEKNWLAEIGFVDVQLQDMDLYDIDSFIDHWHAAAHEVEKIPDNQELIYKLRDNIKLELRNNKNLLKLATNPLLCALICALNRERLSKMPSDRIELYSACIAMFFRRDVERNVSLKDYDDIGTKPKELILSDLAYWLIRNGWSEASTDDVINRVSKKMTNIHGLPEKVTAEGVVKYFIERSGILRHPIASKIDFPHRTFEEYLTAMAIVSEGDYGLLLGNIEDDQWREVIILTCGLARKKEAAKIVEAIMNAGDESLDKREYFHLLAAICSEMVYEMSSEIRSKVESRFKKLIPPGTVAQAKEISKLGELALPYLVYSKNKTYGVNKLKPIMRTLAFIGEEAYLTLKEYSLDKRNGIQQELLEGGKYTKDPVSYGKEVLNHFEKVDLIGRFSLELFTNMNRLKHLIIDVDSNRSKNIDVLARLTNLETLELKYWRKNSLDLLPLESCKKLVYLSLFNSEIKDFNVLNKLISLEKLFLNATAFNDLNDILELKKLKVLGLDVTQVVELNFNKINQLPNLKEILVDKNSRSHYLIKDEIQHLDIELKIKIIELKKNYPKIRITTT